MKLLSVLGGILLGVHGLPAFETEAETHHPANGTHSFSIEHKRHVGYTLSGVNPESLGVDNTTQYAGYLDTADDNHFFYWFFESRNDPENDPTVLWLSGGPGCSSLTALLFELGPSSVNKDLSLKRNPYSWNNNANVIFLDQPLGAGFSYSDKEDVDTTTVAAKDGYIFLELFFKKFPKYLKNEFFITGESYAGHYVPVFANEILSHSDRSFNVSGVAIGNGLTDPLRQYTQYEPMGCGKGGFPAVLSETQCREMKAQIPLCSVAIESCYKTKNANVCDHATTYCNNAMIAPFQSTGLNIYDMRTQCQPTPEGLCYAGYDYLTNYLNQDFVQRALGVNETFQPCNMTVNSDFVQGGDWMYPFYPDVTNLLNSNIMVLVYSGDKDYICNWLGGEAWTTDLDWYGHEEFAATSRTGWQINGKAVGEKRNYDNFTFLRVYQAGHMVPYDQPEVALDMINSFLHGKITY